MKISIITAVFNAEQTIGDTLDSVASQTYANVEHIVIDGASTDNTMQVIKGHRAAPALVISEPDTGIYDAMNKGIQRATGEVIGLLNADDIYASETVLQQIADAHADDKVDACYADLVYVRPDDLAMVVRYWRSRHYQPGLCFKGWMPAHPTFYLKKRVYDKVGLYNTKLSYQSDLEFCARVFEVHKINSCYISSLWVRMRLGGVTNNRLSTIVKGNWESYKALKLLGMKYNPVTYFAIKFGSKLPQFFRRA